MEVLIERHFVFIFFRIYIVHWFSECFIFAKKNLLHYLPTEKPLEGFHIVVDAGNGAGGFFAVSCLNNLLNIYCFLNEFLVEGIFTWNFCKKLCISIPLKRNPRILFCQKESVLSLTLLPCCKTVVVNIIMYVFYFSVKQKLQVYDLQTCNRPNIKICTLFGTDEYGRIYSEIYLLRMVYNFWYFLLLRSGTWVHDFGKES